MAAPNIQIFSWLLENCDNLLKNYVMDTTQNVMTTIAPVATTLFGIYILVWAFMHMRNQIEEPVNDALFRMLKVGLIIGISCNLMYYGTYVVNFAVETPAHFIAAINNQHLNGFQSGFGQVLDKAMSDGFAVGLHIWDQGGLRDIGFYLVAIVVWLAVTLILLFTAGLVLLAKVGLDLLLAIGPVFILLLMFNATRRFFELWLGQVVNFMLTIILTMMAAGLVITILQTFLSGQLSNSTLSPLTTLVQMIALGGVGLLVLRQVPSVASALAGGVAMSTLGSFGAGVKGARGGAAGAGRAGARGARAGARAGARLGQAAMSTRAGLAARRGMANAFRRTNAISPM